jgi:hypothetical protein
VKSAFPPFLFFFVLLSSGFLLAGCSLFPSPGTEPPASPATQSPTWEIKIVDGNVARVEASGETTVLVDKTDYEGVTAFANPQLSPDKTKVCFLAQMMVPIWLYYANADGTGVVAEIDLAKNCAWSHNSQRIAYNNHTTDVSPVDVLVYDTATKAKTNYTKDLSTESVIRNYELPQWSVDDKTITSSFGGLDFKNPDNKVSGTSTINLTTGKVVDN